MTRSLIRPWTSIFRVLYATAPFSSQTRKYSLNYADTSTLLSICGREGNLRLGSSLHASVIKDLQLYNLSLPYNFRNSLVVWNSVIAMYAKCGELCSAVKVFDVMTVRDTISWNTVISGFLAFEKFELGFRYFKQILESVHYGFDQATLTTIFSACDQADFAAVCKMLHGLVMVTGYDREITVGNSLITSYFRCACSDSGKLVFDEMVERNVISWTAVISGLLQNGFCKESFNLFVKMRCGIIISPNYLTFMSAVCACAGWQALREGCQLHALVWKLGMQSDMCIESALMDMYSKCGCLENAWRIYSFANVVDEVSMTVLLVGFAQNGFENEAIQIFVEMVKEGIEVDDNTVSAVLGVFDTGTSLDLGKQVHSFIIKKGFCANVFVNNGLINMYSKCGELEESVEVFVSMPLKNQVSWNSMIAASARHGNGLKALQFYEEMRLAAVNPTDVTFLSLLHACSHVGLVDRGMEFFESMQKVYRISPRMEHLACVVDMLGRAGFLNEAKSFIEGLAVKPDDALIWQAFLGACCIHGDTELGKYAAEKLAMAAPDSPVPYILMANIYSSRGKWKERAKSIKQMKEMGVVSKDTGISWIEIDRKIHSFVVADQMHPQGDAVYGILSLLVKHMREEGYLNCIDIDDEEGYFTLP